jgi:predicted DNA-binding transcriptional regulator AlpA
MIKSQLLSAGSILTAQLLSGASGPNAPSQARPAPQTVDRHSNSISPARPGSIARAGRHCRKSDGSSDREDAPDNGGNDDSGEDPDGSSDGPSDEVIKDERFLTSKAVRARYGNCSDMWIYRRLHDDSGFPRPIEISGRRFWKLSALIAWERARGKPRRDR